MIFTQDPFIFTSIALVLLNWPNKTSFSSNETNKLLPDSVQCLTDHIQVQHCCQGSDDWSHLVESSIISIDSNVTDNIIRKVINIQQEKIKPGMELWETPASTRYSCEDFPLKNHLKLSITESKAKYLTWNSIRLKFVKKTSMSNPVKSLGYIKCYSLSSPRPIKSPSNSICSWLRRHKIILELSKKATKGYFGKFKGQDIWPMWEKRDLRKNFEILFWLEISKNDHTRERCCGGGVVENALALK